MNIPTNSVRNTVYMSRITNVTLGKYTKISNKQIWLEYVKVKLDTFLTLTLD